MFKKACNYIDKYKIIFVIIVGAILRLLYIGRVPGNYNFFQDEAFSAYEAFSLVNYGFDSHGYHNPIYLEVWGSGQSAVQCYIQTIFMRLLGDTPVAIRLPQALLGCITLIFFYLLIKELADQKAAFWSTLVLAICPWHVTMSRWGLDCNYYIGFITIAIYLIVTSRNVLWKTILAAVFTAIALYSYASPWLVMPLLVYGTIVYLLIKKEINFKSVVIFTIVLAVLAAPLFLFILVNLGFIDEIRGSIISIPKLSYFRSDDVKPSLANLWLAVTYFWKQYDWISWDSTPKYCTYFLFSNAFLVIGLIKDLFKRNKRAIVMWIWFLCGLIMSLSIEPNFERLNILFLPLIYFIGTGITYIIACFNKLDKVAFAGMLLLYGINSFIFAQYYFTGYNEMMERQWPDGAQEAIEFAQHYGTTIHVADIRHPIVLYYSKYPTDKYVETVVYADDNAKFLQPLYWDGYDFRDYFYEDAVKGDVYICAVDNTEAVEWLVSQDMKYAQFGVYYIGIAN